MRQQERKEQNLVKYKRGVRQSANQKEWLKHFLELMQSLQDSQGNHLDIEHQVQDKWEYALIGTLVFEFRKEIHNKWGAGNDRLKRHLMVLKAANPNTSLAAVTTNGLAFHIYNPRYESDGKVVELEIAGGLNLANPRLAPAKALQDLVAMVTRTAV